MLPPGYTAAGEVLTSAQASMGRYAAANSGLSTGTGNLRFAYFTANETLAINNLTVLCGGTAAGATPTLVQMGVFTVDGSGNLTPVANTTNNTALLASTNTAYTQALTTGEPYTLIAGNKYAYGLLVVTAATPPTVYGATLNAAEFARAPRLSGFVASQSVWPSSQITAGSV